MARSGRDDALTELREWCLAVLEQMSTHAELASFAGSAREATTRCAQRGDLGGLRSVTGDLLEMASHSPRDLWKAMDVAVRARCGRGLREEAERAAKTIRACLDRGAIRTEREYRTVASILADVARPDAWKLDRARLEALAGAFEARAEVRGNR